MLTLECQGASAKKNSDTIPHAPSNERWRGGLNKGSMLRMQRPDNNWEDSWSRGEAE
jgi:hypothetical protein